MRPSRRQRQADALGDIVRGYLEAGGAPVAGGARPQVVLTVPLPTLDRTDPGGLAVVRPDPRTGAGTEVGAETARRIACDATVTVMLGRDGDIEVTNPAVDPALLTRMLEGIPPALGGIPFEPLALGRAVRLVTPAQRAALNARDRGCVAPGCTAGLERCQAHHLIAWAEGGRTDLAVLVLLCTWHHHLVHEGAWTLQRHQHTGAIELRPPPDP